MNEESVNCSDAFVLKRKANKRVYLLHYNYCGTIKVCQLSIGKNLPIEQINFLNGFP